MTDERFEIIPAVRSNVGLFIGLPGGTGSGKTYSAMRIAKGIVGPGNKFGVVDTENKRASHYADEFDFDVIDMESPYASTRYEGAVTALYKAGYKAIVVDSASHEHDGYGGYLDSQAHDLEVRVERYLKKYPNKSEFEAMEALKPSSYITPKLNRKRMMQTLLACSATVPIIFCFRAEEKTFMSKDGKLVARPKPEWEAICGKGLPFEMTVFLMLDPDNPGRILKAIKLPAKLAHMFPLDRLLDEECGKKIAEWSKGSPRVNVASNTDRYINAEEWKYIKGCLAWLEVTDKDLLDHLKLTRGGQIKTSMIDDIKSWMSLIVDKRNAQ